MIEISKNKKLLRRLKSKKVTLDEISDLIAEQSSLSYEQSYDDGYEEGARAGHEEGYQDGLKGKENMRDLVCEDNPRAAFYSELHDIFEAFRSGKMDYEEAILCISRLDRNYHRAGFCLGFREGYEEYYSSGFDTGEEDGKKGVIV